jgi:hypothetical protein
MRANATKYKGTKQKSRHDGHRQQDDTDTNNSQHASIMFYKYNSGGALLDDDDDDDDGDDSTDIYLYGRRPRLDGFIISIESV